MAVTSMVFARSPARLVAVVCAAQVLVQIGAFFWPALGRNLKAMTIARIAIAIVPASLVLLFFARGDLWQLVAFTLLLGASQGVITIVRGAVPLALFGTTGYGTMLGLIATPILLVNAFSPAVFALLIDQFGCSIATWIAIELMSRWYERAQARPFSELVTGA